MKFQFLTILVFLVLMGCETSSTNVNQTAVPAVKPAVTGPVALAIEWPTEGEVVHSNDVAVKFRLENYEIAPEGQHIHLILDNEPYVPVYSVSEPYLLKDVKSGIHTLRAFPSRAWHESIKEHTAFASLTFYVESKKGKPPVDFSKEPVLTYSRPKGKYEGQKANSILFDFWLSNAELEKNGYQVRYTIDKKRPEVLDQWRPIYFQDLSTGKHTLVVELIDRKGKLVKGQYNRTEREFEVLK